MQLIAYDLLGGQIWGYYGDDGNTTRGRRTDDNPHSSSPNRNDGRISSVTAVIAIPTAAPFAIADLISPDFLQILLQIGDY